MAKKRKSSAQHGDHERQSSKAASASPKPIFASPFKDLKKLIAERAENKAAAGLPLDAPLLSSSAGKSGGLPAELDRADESAVDDTELFRQAFEGVRPLGAPSALRVGVEPTVKRAVVSEDAEVMAELSDLVSGQGPFELTETEEYVEGMRVGLDPRLVTRLRRGEFSVQAHLDLHGMIQVDAKEALTTFVLDSVQKGRRAVLVVHGRGLRSPGGQPVLKHAVAQWLSHGTIGGYVLAFTTARAYDGGTGAMWVLLRRERRRAKFDVLQGTRRRD